MKPEKLEKGLMKKLDLVTMTVPLIGIVVLCALFMILPELTIQKRFLIVPQLLLQKLIRHYPQRPRCSGWPKRISISL